MPLHQKAYQAFGDLLLDFPDIREPEITDYRRDLALDTAIASTRYVLRATLTAARSSPPSRRKVMVVRLTGSRPGRISFEAGLQSAARGLVPSNPSGGAISMTGKVTSRRHPL